MKRFVILVSVFVFLLSFSINSYAAKKIFDVPENISVNDFSDVLNDSTENYINSSNEMLLGMTKSKIIFVTVPSTENESIDEYCNRLYRSWGVSSIGDMSSTFVLLATDDMQYWAIVGSHLSSALTREELEGILITHMEPEFANGNFDAAVKNTFVAISDWYTSHYNTSLNSFDDSDENASKKKDRTGLHWFLNIVIAILAIVGICYYFIRRRLRLQAIQMRKHQRLQRYRRAGAVQRSNDYEYFEYYDTSENSGYDYYSDGNEEYSSESQPYEEYSPEIQSNEE